MNKEMSNLNIKTVIDTGKNLGTVEDISNAHVNKTRQNDSVIDNIRTNLAEDWEVLSTVYDWLHKENVLCHSKNNVNDVYDDQRTKVINFLQPEELKQKIDLKIGEEGASCVQDIADICSQVIKYSVKTSNPGFHNQLFGQLDPYGLAGAWITEALNTNAYTYEVAPVFSLIETEIMKKVCEIIGFPHGDGIFAPGGSISNMYGIVLARYKRFPNIKNQGVFGMKPMVIFTSQDAHYSLQKAAHWLGFGNQNCIVVKTNRLGQMLLDDLECQIQRVISENKLPLLVNATAGTTVLGAFDNIQGIADICAKYDIWLHVDACLGGSAMLSFENRHLLTGIERSNSFAWNPHKTLGAPCQCSLFVTCESGLLAQCNSLEVHYLFQQDKFYDVSYDTGNKSVQCGRKVDAFKFWLMLKARGCAAYGRLVDNAITTARRFRMKLEQRDGFRLVLPEFQYSNICFWYIPQALRNKEETAEWWNALNCVAPKIKEQMVYDGNILLGYSPLQHHGLKNFFRMVFTCFPIMNDKQLDEIIDEMERLGKSIDI